MARKRRGQISIIIPDDAPIVGARDAAAWRRMGAASGWFVYTAWEANRRIVPPLYVGFTGNLHQRLSTHRREQAWWPLVGDIVIEHFSDKLVALNAEEDRIFVLEPLFNKASNRHTPRSERR